MPSEKSIKEALLLTENDTTKALGLKVGDHNVQLGQYIPRAGIHHFYTHHP